MGKLKEISSFKKREIARELEKEGPNNYAIMFKGQKKFWKVVRSKRLADKIVSTLKSRGKAAEVVVTAAPVTESKSEEAVYPHKMYDPKTGKEYTAKTPEDHERMAKLGYTHDDPNSSEKQESVKVRKNKTGMMGSKTQVHKDKKKELSKTAARKKVSMDEKVEYLTLNQIKKNWAKEYPGTKFKFQVSKYKGAEILSVLSPKGNELESYNKVPGQGWTVREMKEEIEKEIEEGVDDPAIFKAVFLAGGPGSGKSFMVGKTGLTSLGFRVINSDDVFEYALKKAGLEPIPKVIWSPKGQKIRGDAKKVSAKQMDLYINGRLGLVIDGTGKDYNKIKKQATDLKELGYDVGMIFVNTNLETAIDRDSKRKRTLGAKDATVMWNQVQDNLGKFQNFFGKNFIIVDNSEGANWEAASLSAYKKFSKFAKEEPKNPIAKKWIKDAGGRLKDAKENVDKAVGTAVTAIAGAGLAKGISSLKKRATGKGRDELKKAKVDKVTAPFDRKIAALDDQIADLEDLISDIKEKPTKNDSDEQKVKSAEEKIEKLKDAKRKIKDQKRQKKNKTLGIKDSFSLDMQRKLAMVECVLGRVNMDIQIAESITLDSKPSEIKELYKKLHGKNDKGRSQQTR